MVRTFSFLLLFLLSAFLTTFGSIPGAKRLQHKSWIWHLSVILYCQDCPLLISHDLPSQVSSSFIRWRHLSVTMISLHNVSNNVSDQKSKFHMVFADNRVFMEPSVITTIFQCSGRKWVRNMKSMRLSSATIFLWLIFTGPKGGYDLLGPPPWFLCELSSLMVRVAKQVIWVQSSVKSEIFAGSLEAAYSLNWDAREIWGKGGEETLALLW